MTKSSLLTTLSNEMLVFANVSWRKCGYFSLEKNRKDDRNKEIKILFIMYDYLTLRLLPMLRIVVGLILLSLQILDTDV